MGGYNVKKLIKLTFVFSLILLFSVFLFSCFESNSEKELSIRYKGYMIYDGAEVHTAYSDIETIEDDIKVFLLSSSGSGEEISDYNIIGIPEEYKLGAIGNYLTVRVNGYPDIKFKLIVDGNIAAFPELIDNLTVGLEPIFAFNHPGGGYTLISGTQNPEFSGNFHATFALEPGYVWEDGSTENKTINYTVNKTRIAYPEHSTALYYNGTMQHIVDKTALFGYYITDGRTFATDAGKYSYTAKLHRNFTWEDGSEEDFIAEWEIEPMRTYPPASTDFVYNGEKQFLKRDISGFIVNSNNPNCTESAIDVGYYSTYYILANDNYIWVDGTRDEVRVDWGILTAFVKKPEAISGLYYNGEEQLGVSYTDGIGYSLTSGTISATDASSEYTATFTLDGNHSWRGSGYNTRDNEPYTVTWKIEKQILEIPTAAKDLSYTSEPIAGVLNASSPGIREVAGSIYATDRGEYSVTLGISDTNNYIWEDGTYTDKNYKYKIDQMLIPWPTEIKGLVYTGEEQVGIICDYDERFVRISESACLSAVNAGEYYALFYIIDTYNTAFLDPVLSHRYDYASASFKIEKAENEWITELYFDKDVFVGEAIVPHVEAKFGNAKVLWSDPNEYNPWNETVPTGYSIWKCYAMVEETENYTGLSTYPDCISVINTKEANAWVKAPELKDGDTITIGSFPELEALGGTVKITVQRSGMAATDGWPWIAGIYTVYIEVIPSGSYIYGPIEKTVYKNIEFVYAD